MGRLRQSALRWSRTGAPFTRSFFPSGRPLQFSIARVRWRQRHVPLARLRSRKRSTCDDHCSRGVHPPIPHACAPEELRPHPALRFYGQPPAVHILPTLPCTAGNGASSSLTRNGFDNFGPVVSELSDSINYGREIDCTSDRLAIRIEMLFRYVVAEIPNPDSQDVPMHADVEVCLYPGDPSSSRLRFQEQLSKIHDWAPRMRLRRPPFNLVASLPVKTSTRIPVLSP